MFWTEGLRLGLIADAMATTESCEYFPQTDVQRYRHFERLLVGCRLWLHQLDQGRIYHLARKLGHRTGSRICRPRIGPADRFRLHMGRSTASASGSLPGRYPSRCRPRWLPTLRAGSTPLRSAVASFASPYGTIRSAWSVAVHSKLTPIRGPVRVSYNVTVPANTSWSHNLRRSCVAGAG